MQQQNQIQEIYCKGCGCKLTYVAKFEGLPCNTYCCGKCCPWAKESPCPKEKKFGDFFS